jgi:hypothetical protein
VRSVVTAVFQYGDAADDRSIAARQEEVGVGMAVVRVLVAVHLQGHIHPQRRDPQWVTGVQAVWQVEESLHLVAPSGVDGLDGDTGPSGGGLHTGG